MQSYSVFTAIDFETANNNRNSACQIGLARVEDGNIVKKLTKYLKPPTAEFSFSHIHKITANDVSRAQTFSDFLPEFEKFAEGSERLVAHNASFDASVLKACYLLAAKGVPKFEFACTLKASRQLLSLPAYKLSDICRHLGIPLKHHDAGSDAEACAMIQIWLQENSR